MSSQVDIFHPLTTFEWEECKEFIHREFHKPQCVVLKDRVYIRLEPKKWGRGLFTCLVSDLSTWRVRVTPCEHYALTTYQSKLVLVGGLIALEGEYQYQNTLWVSEDTGTSWDSSSAVPHMVIARSSPSAVSAGDPEFMVVAGGHGIDKELVKAVEVLMNGQWWMVEPLPQVWACIVSTIHLGSLYLMGEYSGNKTIVLHCKLGSLLANIQSNAGTTPPSQSTRLSHSEASSTSRSDFDTTTGLHSQSNDQSNSGATLPSAATGKSSVWRKLIIKNGYSYPFSFGKELLVLHESVRVSSSIVSAYSFHSQSWVRIQDMPHHMMSTMAKLLPSGDLMVVGRLFHDHWYHGHVVKVFKVAVKANLYRSDSLLSMSTLFRLEALDFPVLGAMYEACIQVPAISQPTRTRGASDVEYLECMIKAWLSGKSGSGDLPPTLKSMLLLLREYGHADLSQRIENYLTCRLTKCMHGVLIATDLMSLRELCMSVVLCALLQRGSLELDTGLPRYVPLMVKRAIMHNLTPYTGELSHPSS